MNSSVIGKIEKARRYAQEKHRIRFESFEVSFRGENGDHKVNLSGDKLRCTCDFFAGYSTCAHTMALERVLEGMLPVTTSSHLLERA